MLPGRKLPTTHFHLTEPNYETIIKLVLKPAKTHFRLTGPNYDTIIKLVLKPAYSSVKLLVNQLEVVFKQQPGSQMTLGSNK